MINLLGTGGMPQKRKLFGPEGPSPLEFHSNQRLVESDELQKDKNRRDDFLLFFRFINF